MICITCWMRNISNTDYTNDTDYNGYISTLLYVLNSAAKILLSDLSANLRATNDYLSL